MFCLRISHWIAPGCPFVVVRSNQVGILLNVLIMLNNKESVFVFPASANPKAD